jgi:hypothetical protein
LFTAAGFTAGPRNIKIQRHQVVLSQIVSCETVC